MNKKLCIVHCALCIALSGCLLGPNYTRPEAQVPEKWIGNEERYRHSPAILAEWWEQFQDEILTNLIHRAFENNLDLLQAAERVRQARAVLVQTGGSLQPTLDASGGASRRYNSNTGWSSLYSASLDAAWELDIFGGNRRAVEAAEADLRVSEAARRGIRVTLAAEVANAYFTFRLHEQLRHQTEQNIALLEHSAQIARDRNAAGWVSSLDVANAEGQLESTRAQLPLFDSEKRSAQFALELLLAQLPGTLDNELPVYIQPEFGLLPVAFSLPSELLQRRPDIQRAEAQLAAAIARIGVAEADRFPKFRLLAGVGLNANVLEDWSRTLSLGPGISAPIFNAGRLRARVEEREAFAQEKLLAYRQTVLAAFSEVEDALQAFFNERARSEPIRKAWEHYGNAANIANGLYDLGETDYTDVLLADRSRLSSEEALIRNEFQIKRRLIALYKALGGGWEEEEENP